MARLTVDLEFEQVRAIISDLDGALEPVGFARLHGGVNDVYRIEIAAAAPLVLKIYGDEPAWIVAKEALVAGWIGGRAGIPIPRWLRVDERRTYVPFRFALMMWLPGVTVRSLIGAPDIDAAYRQMGSLLRRLHTIPMTAYGYIVGDGIGRPQPTKDEYMRSAFNHAFRQFRDQGAGESLDPPVGKVCATAHPPSAAQRWTCLLPRRLAAGECVSRAWQERGPATHRPDRFWQCPRWRRVV